MLLAGLLAAAAIADDGLQARSADGRWLLRADNARRQLVAQRTADGEVVRRIAVADRHGATSRVARVLDAPPRRSFIVLLSDLPEVWELSYDPEAAPVYDGLVHDYRMGEGIASGGPFPVRRIVVDQPLTEALFSDDFAHLVARAAPGVLHVVNLHVRRRIETVPLDGDIHLNGAAWWRRDGDLLLALPDRTATRLHLLAARGWRLRASLALPRAARRVEIVAPQSLRLHFDDGSTVVVTP